MNIFTNEIFFESVSICIFVSTWWTQIFKESLFQTKIYSCTTEKILLTQQMACAALPDIYRLRYVWILSFRGRRYKRNSRLKFLLTNR